MYNHAIRITKPYSDVKDVIDLWATRSQEVAVYQHDADEEVKQTHVHMILLGCEVKEEQLKRDSKLPAGGNKLWSFKQQYEDVSGNKVPIDRQFITYMSKGKLSPVFLKNISQEEVESSRQKWVDPVKDDTAKSDPLEPIIRDVVKYFKNYVIDRPISFDDYGHSVSRIEELLSEVRTKTLKVLYHRTRRVPHGSQFKIIAGTAFLRICEEKDKLDIGMSQLQKLWY